MFYVTITALTQSWLAMINTNEEHSRVWVIFAMCKYEDEIFVYVDDYKSDDIVLEESKILEADYKIITMYLKVEKTFCRNHNLFRTCFAAGLPGPSRKRAWHLRHHASNNVALLTAYFFKTSVDCWVGLLVGCFYFPYIYYIYKSNHS